jgi:hypothetical protein
MRMTPGLEDYDWRTGCAERMGRGGIKMRDHGLMLGVNSQRNLPARGFRPGLLLLGMFGVMGYGWYKLTIGIREHK